ncbi:S-adenosyl-L-methionine-dependent methyltransferase [Parathielavia appendiculata]|uniref:S-adenosyl-L-methionine-dependent methyltransferase n=1 Tax=Parathielavia appendiculata TaxID=2587402 RepID=A0AAN6U1R2_9PEZI|nr:S-adenosyl-L-methionine-dependent methyltransferase [Parathielavia appendiculata]
MEQPPSTPALTVVTESETRSKKRSRAETDASPTEVEAPATLPSTKTTEPRPIKDPAPQASARGRNDSRSTSLEPPASLAGDSSVSAHDSTSAFSLHDSAFSESITASDSLPNLSTGPRGSLSPPYMFSGTSRSSNSGPEPAVDGETEPDLDALEEQAAVAQAEEGSIVVDSDDLGTDDGYGTDNNTTASTSLAESVRDYIFENGRRYHRFREGRYNFPNDDVEQQREDMKHTMVKLLCGQLYFAPIGEHPHEILDIGTGTGIWAIEMGDLFPGANILGVDLSPIQPEWVPPNVRFMVDDVESPWLHPRNYFDYVHSRHTVMAIKDWPRLMRRTLEHLRPGGWFEMQEVYHFPISVNNSMPPDHPVAQYWSLINEGLGNLGINFHAAANGRLAEMMRDVGFVNVTERVLQIPIGTWAKNKVLKTVGLYWRTILVDGMQAIALGPLSRGCGWSREQIELFLVEVRKAYHDNSMLAYMPLHIVYGQKPAGY